MLDSKIQGLSSRMRAKVIEIDDARQYNLKNLFRADYRPNLHTHGAALYVGCSTMSGFVAFDGRSGVRGAR